MAGEHFAAMTLPFQELFAALDPQGEG